MKTKILLFFILIFSLVSCGQKETEEISEFDRQNFFDVVYETLAARELGATNWILTDGDRDVKFKSTVSIEDDEDLPDFVEGNFQFALESYTRSQAIAPCTGGWDGDFSLDLFLKGGSGSDITDAGDTPYSVLDPYDPEDGSSSIDPEDVVDEIKTYYFSLTVKNVSLFPQESCSFPFTNHTLKAIRFPNGTLILEDSSKGLEYFLRPKLRTKR